MDVMSHPWVTAGQGNIRFGVGIGPAADWPRLVEFVQRAEGLGYDAYWAVDHPTRAPGCWTTLAGLAAGTRTLRLGTLVNCVLYRSPAELARMAADVDRMSAGRLILGLGIGVEPLEFEQLGLSMPPVTERMAAMVDTIQTIREMWGQSSDALSRQAEWHTSRMLPAPCQSPRIPVLIAGGGEQVTLRLVAQYADAGNLIPAGDSGPVGSLSLDDVARKSAVLAGFCAELGRPFASVLRTYTAVPVVIASTPAQVSEKLHAVPERLRLRFRTTTIAGTPADVVRAFHPLVARGITYFITYIMGNDLETLELLAEQVQPALQASL
jgi:alkanesulfonate monooxygenase SsuD/methylene tetrahydromethanopterin reductase-like flavin-dependent oxidoreductase (luciferase family)